MEKYLKCKPIKDNEFFFCTRKATIVMDIFEAISKRHSYRGEFTDDALPRDHLVRIVEAGMSAPSGKNCQTTEFVIVDDPVKITEIAEITRKSYFRTAKAIIACVVRPARVYHGFSFEVEDCSAAVENMLLAITALGYASVWIDGYLRLDGIAARIGALLRIPGPRYVRVILPIGVPKEEFTGPEKKPFAERAFFNTYGGDPANG